MGTGVTAYNAAGQVVADGRSIVAYVANNANARYVVAGFGSARQRRPEYVSAETDRQHRPRVKKRFNITERFSFDIGAQLFNIFNHAQYTGGFVGRRCVERLYRRAQRSGPERPAVRALRPVLQQQFTNGPKFAHFVF